MGKHKTRTNRLTGVPKDGRVNKVTFEFGVYDVVSHFNNGYIAPLQTYEDIGLNCGYYITLACNVGNKAQIQHARVQILTKKRRRFLRVKT